jgi:hypothetical protein
MHSYAPIQYTSHPLGLCIIHYLLLAMYPKEPSLVSRVFLTAEANLQTYVIIVSHTLYLTTIINTKELTKLYYYYSYLAPFDSHGHVENKITSFRKSVPYDEFQFQA